jgi:hypothetical protein
VDERVGVPQVIEEAIPQTFAHVCAGNEAGDVEELNGDRAPAVDAGAVVGFTSFGDVHTGAGAFNLEVADGSLGVDCCESSRLKISGCRCEACAASVEVECCNAL